MKTHLIADWISNAPQEIRNIFDPVSQPTFSRIQMEDRIRSFATLGHFLAGPWKVRFYLMNPEQMDWEQVRRMVKGN